MLTLISSTGPPTSTNEHHPLSILNNGLTSILLNNGLTSILLYNSGLSPAIARMTTACADDETNTISGDPQQAPPPCRRATGMPRLSLANFHAELAAPTTDGPNEARTAGRPRRGYSTPSSPICTAGEEEDVDEVRNIFSMSYS